MTALPLWSPSETASKETRLHQFKNQFGHEAKSFDELYDWSITNPDVFWDQVWTFTNIIGTKGNKVIEPNYIFRKTTFFPDSTLNFAENLLRKQDDSDAMVFWGEDQVKSTLSWNELYTQVQAFQGFLIKEGVKSGDRVAAYLPNMPQTIIAMIATASLGAIWSSCSPDFGVPGVLDRFKQIEPKIFITIDVYYYNSKKIQCRTKSEEIISHLPSVQKVVEVSYDPNNSDISFPSKTWIGYESIIKDHSDHEISFKQLPFNHPLFIMFSSGTTGKPKCILHGAGGTLIQHLKEHQLHTDIRSGDRFFYFTTCGWMMWNWLATGLASEATLILYDGAPFLSDTILFDLIDQERVTHFGTSAKYIDTCKKKELSPLHTHKLDSLRVMTSTGSPLAPESFTYVYDHIKKDLNLASISGGTDIVSCFALGSSQKPVYAGELQTRGLGLAVDVYDDTQSSVHNQKGELVCTAPFPCMPVGFWNDENDEKYIASYFSKFENIWCHGDYVRLTPNNGLIFYGRSDATLNSGGVRIGTAEIYRQVEQIPEVLESVCIGQEWDNDTRIILFITLKDTLTLDEELKLKIAKHIRKNTTPRHVPAKIIQVSDIPRTASGKISEKSIHAVVHNQNVSNTESLANPDSLMIYKDISELNS